MALHVVFYCIFLILVENLEPNDGSEEKLCYMSNGLIKILGEKE